MKERYLSLICDKSDFSLTGNKMIYKLWTSLKKLIFFQMSFLLMDGDENLLVDSAQQFSLKLGCEQKAQVTKSFKSKKMAFI